MRHADHTHSQDERQKGTAQAATHARRDDDDAEYRAERCHESRTRCSSSSQHDEDEQSHDPHTQEGARAPNRGMVHSMLPCHRRRGPRCRNRAEIWASHALVVASRLRDTHERTSESGASSLWRMITTGQNDRADAPAKITCAAGNHSSQSLRLTHTDQGSQTERGRIPTWTRLPRLSGVIPLRQTA
jgi:hypothetical protein